MRPGPRALRAARHSIGTGGVPRPPGVGSVAVSDRELVVLGTASQAPTRSRNHNGYLLLWDDEGLLFDPGEGTQRQMLFAGVTASRITRIYETLEQTWAWLASRGFRRILEGWRSGR